MRKGLLFLLLLACPLGAQNPSADRQAEITERVVAELAPLREAPAGELMTRAALALRETPYVGGTLDAPAPDGTWREELRVYLDKTDCILFVETCMNLALAVRRQGAAADYPLLQELVLQSRYRDGKAEKYSDRIHYTTEWIEKGVSRGLLEDLTLPLGGRKYDHPLHFMTNHYMDYPHLADAHDPKALEDLKVIAAVEERLNAAGYTYLPKEKIAGASGKFRSGDILCFVTSTSGLDISHVALVLVHDGKGNPVAPGTPGAVVGFIHASPGAGKVAVDPKTIVQYVLSRNKISGIKIVRPVF